MRKKLLCAAVVIAFLFVIVPTIPQVEATSSNNTGLTAKIVATSHQVITGTINATGFDIGVYVGPGVTGVMITRAKIFGANDHGIFIQDTSHIVVRNCNITGNGVPSSSHKSLIAQDKAITLSGTSHVMIANNFVGFNMLDGGIAITDDGSFNPGALNPGSPQPGNWNIVMGNLIKDNLVGCGIVVAAFNPGQGVSYNLIMGNTVVGNSPGPSSLPFLGGIIVAADTPFTTAANNMVLRNTVIGGWVPGIIVHSNAPGDFVIGTLIVGNKLDSNGLFPPGSENPLLDDATKPTGINIVAEVAPGEPNAPVLTNTLVLANKVTNDCYGVWHLYDTNTKIIHLYGNAVIPVAP